MPFTPDEITSQYDESVNSARDAYTNASTRLNGVQAQYDAISAEDVGDGTGPRAAEAAALLKQITALQTTYSTAQQGYTEILHQRADAVVKAKDNVDPTKRAQLEAQSRADIAKATQIEGEAAEYTTAAPERRAAAADNSRLLKAKADEAEYALGVEKETDPVKKAAAQAALDRAKADTARVVAETGQIGKAAPQTPEQQRAAAAAATVAEAGAGTAGATAAANLSTLEANAATAQATLADAQRRARQAPTDAQAQQAVQQALDTAQTANDTAQQALASAKAKAPGDLAQQGATLESTQAGIRASDATVQKGLQGDLYGLQDKIKQIRDLIASGEIKPDQGDQMISAARLGTNVYDVQKQQQADATAARSQDVSNKNQMASSFGSTFNAGMSTFGDLNKTGAIGSDATGKAFLATLGLAQDYLKSYAQPAATPTDYLGTGPGGVSGMVNQAQQQLASSAPPIASIAGAPPSAVAPAPTLPAGFAGTNSDPLTAGSPAHQPITINIGGPPTGANSTSAGGNQDMYGAGTGTPPLAGLVSAASSAVPAGPTDVDSLYPGAAERHRRSGLQLS